MPLFRPAVFILLITSMAAGAQPQLAPDPEHKALPPGAGRDTVIRVCSKCHEPEIVAQQQFDAKGWDDLVEQMASNGAKGSDDEFKEIKTYLAASFPVK